MPPKARWAVQYSDQASGMLRKQEAASIGPNPKPRTMRRLGFADHALGLVDPELETLGGELLDTQQAEVPPRVRGTQIRYPSILYHEIPDKLF